MPSPPGARALAMPADCHDGGGFVRLSDVTEREIDWYWPRRIARANVVLVAGDGGVGKSTMVQALAAGMSRGLPVTPGGAPTEPRAVVLLSAEEDASAVIRPRMRLMGADLERVSVLDLDDSGLTLPSGAERLEARCRQENAGMVVVDTGPAFLDPGLKSNNEEDVRRFFAPLRLLAERLRLVVIVLAHLNKDTSRTAGQRVMGGAAWRNVPRQVLMVGAPRGEDPQETPDRLVVVEKSNLGSYPPAVAFTLTPAHEDTERAVIAWGAEVTGVHASDLVSAAPTGDERTEREAAVEFLRAELADGPRLAAELKDAATDAGLDWHTLRKVRRTAGITTSKAGFDAGWRWSLDDSSTKREDPDPPARKDDTVSLGKNPSTMRALGQNDSPTETASDRVSLRTRDARCEDWRDLLPEGDCNSVVVDA